MFKFSVVQWVIKGFRPRPVKYKNMPLAPAPGCLPALRQTFDARYLLIPSREKGVRCFSAGGFPHVDGRDHILCWDKIRPVYRQVRNSSARLPYV